MGWNTCSRCVVSREGRALLVSGGKARGRDMDEDSPLISGGFDDFIHLKPRLAEGTLSWLSDLTGLICRRPSSEVSCIVADVAMDDIDGDPDI